jgi:hypothetical protein
MPEKRGYVTIGKILTDVEITKAANIFKNDNVNFHSRCLEELVRPNMERINRSLGQENSPDYIAYMVEYAMIRAFR